MGNCMRKLNLLIIVLAAMAVFAMPVRATTLKLLSSWPESMLFVKGAVEPFADNLKRLSHGNLGIAYFGPDVIPTLEQLQPVQSGVFDLLYTIPAYHMGTTAIGAAVDAIEPGPQRLRQTGIFDYIDAQYQRLGLKLVAIIPITDLHFMTREAIDGRQPSFDGLKLRTIGTVAPLVKALGGAPVNLPSGEVFTSLQKGIIDGATIITFGAIDFKWHEVTRYMVRPTFGFLSTLLLMNLDRYNALAPEAKTVLDEAGASTELSSQRFFAEKKSAEETALIEKGIAVTRMNAVDAAKVNRLYQETIWKLTIDKSGDAVAELRTMARAKDLTP